MDDSIRRLTNKEIAARQAIRDHARASAAADTGVHANPLPAGSADHQRWEHDYWAAVAELEEVCF